ncbi:MAG: cyclohexanone monooxygenase, partial [Candidatus Azotimanducaceae bacterium]
SGGLEFNGAYADPGVSLDANQFAAEFIREKVRGIVKDPDKAEFLSPKGVLARKRLCVDANYHATFNRDNVSLANVSKDTIRRITPHGLMAGETEHKFHELILATGFDAITGALLKINIRGRGGLTLLEKSEAGPRTDLGRTVSGFPNLFTVSGPGSASVLSNMISTIEQHDDWITGSIDYLHAKSLATLEANIEEEDQWITQGNEFADMTLMPKYNSWCLGANVPEKPRVFMPFVGGIPMYF